MGEEAVVLVVVVQLVVVAAVEHSADQTQKSGRPGTPMHLGANMHILY